MISYSSRFLGKLIAIIIPFFLIGFLGISEFPALGYGAESLDGSNDDRLALVGNHPVDVETTATTGNLDPSTQLDLKIRFAIRHQAALEKLLAEQHDPASPHFYKWLGTGEFFTRFGPSKAEVNAVRDWLREEGFEVNEVAAGYIDFGGSADQVQRAFEVRIAKFGTADAFANTTDPYIPARFAEVIGAVTGMDNMTHALPVSQNLNAASLNPQAVVGSVQAFGPGDLYSFYDENPAPGRDGAGDCIAIVGTSDFLDSAMSAYTTQFGLAPINYTRELHGANPGINGAEIEAEIDLQWSHATAPGASIVYHLGGDLVADMSGAVNDNQCGAISISYGFCGPSAAFINAIIHPIFEQAAVQGQSVFVSSGDQGVAGLGYDPATNQCVLNNSPLVNEVAADPDVTSVGGTQFTPTFVAGNDQGFTPEAVWNDGSGASGGGASQIFTKPAYQAGPGVPDDGMRDVPDLALMASPSAPGAFIGHDVGGSAQVICCAGGTSLSAPMWAGFSRALAEASGQTRLGNFNTIIYTLANQNYAAAGFRAVTIGNNGLNDLPGFNAGPGYNQATGWGTVYFEVFAAAVKQFLNPGARLSPTPTRTPTPSSTPTATPTPTGGMLSAPSTLNFPTTATGRPGMMKTLVIRNLSRTSPLYVQLGALAAPFSISGGEHYSIAPASTVPISILFSPTQCGTATQSLQIRSSDPKHPSTTVKVKAQVQGGKLSAPAQIVMNAPLDGVVTRTVTLKNSGAGVLSGTVRSFGVNSPFSLMGGPVSFWLAAGQTQPVTIQFKAGSAGTTEAQLTIAMAEPAGTASMNVMGSAK